MYIENNMKYLVGFGKGKKPGYNKDSGKVILHPPFGKLDISKIFLRCQYYVHRA